MNRKAAITALKSGRLVYLQDRNHVNPSQPGERHQCWLDEDGDLVHRHPTDPRGMPVSPPESNAYRVYSD